MKESDSESFDHSLLVTRNWILIVPRTKSAWEGNDNNSIGYAFNLLAFTAEKAEKMKEKGLMEILKHCAIEKKNELKNENKL